MVLEEEKEPRSGGHGLSIDDVTNQGRYLLNNFIRERIERDNIANAPGIQELQEPDTPLGKTLSIIYTHTISDPDCPYFLILSGQFWF